jgi:cyclic dehypoxanthinyl futalosine synthase
MHDSAEEYRMSGTVSESIRRVLQKSEDGVRLTPEDGLLLAQSSDLIAIGRAAERVTRRLHPEPYRTYNIDRNINYTNICAAECDFCAFFRKRRDADAYLLPREELYKKIQETIDLGGDQILMQGGLHPTLGIEWYEELLSDLKGRFPTVNLHAFSPPELWHLHKITRIPLSDMLRRLKDAGLGSIPGGGGEILVDRVRSAITRGKCMTDEWLAVMRAWHELGGRSSATMMFGHVETLAERIEHLDRLRQLQDETGGFTAFICWTFQKPEGHEANSPYFTMHHVPTAGAFEYLKMQAIARIYLDNFANIQSSWVTQGPKIGQAALFFGANDMGSLMIEENVVSAAGTVYCLSLEEIRSAIREVGYVPRQRNVFYQLIDAEPADCAVSA